MLQICFAYHGKFKSHFTILYNYHDGEQLRLHWGEFPLPSQLMDDYR